MSAFRSLQTDLVWRRDRGRTLRTTCAIAEDRQTHLIPFHRHGLISHLAFSEHKGAGVAKKKTNSKYHGRATATVKFINELIKIAKEMKAAEARGEKMGFTEAELAFYDAPETNDSAVKVLGDKVLRTIAVEIADSIAKNATIDWDKRENVRAKMRVTVKRILRKYDYPPDKQEKAVQTVMDQAELTCKNVIEALA